LRVKLREYDGSRACPRAARDRRGGWTAARTAYTGRERRRAFINRSWPLPAFARRCGACWIVFAFIAQLGAAPRRRTSSLAALVGAALSLIGATPWRRVFVGCGFPILFAVLFGSGRCAAGVGALAWRSPPSSIRCRYPGARRHADLFRPTAGALRGHRRKGVPARAAGGACSMPAAASRAGLLELRREYPEAALGRHRMELAALARCRGALPLRAHPARRFWSADWFALRSSSTSSQRPRKHGARAAKAAHELIPARGWRASSSRSRACSRSSSSIAATVARLALPGRRFRQRD
jgi:hypothetical protein